MEHTAEEVDVLIQNAIDMERAVLVSIIDKMEVAGDYVSVAVADDYESWWESDAEATKGQIMQLIKSRIGSSI